MNKDIFDFKDYKFYIKYRIRHLPRAGRGAKIAMARAMGSPTSHISQVLSGSSHFSFEQAEALNSHWTHTEEEADFFLLLVQLARAGTPALSKRIQQQMEQILRRRLNLKERLGVRAEILPVDQATFYSSWLYGAIHVMVTIPKFQNAEAIAAYLGLSLRQARDILEFLTSIGLIVRQGTQYKIGTSRIHLGNDSPLISKFHTNWRMKAIQSFEKDRLLDNLHYSSAITISEADSMRIKSILVKQIDEIKQIIRDSKEEGVHCFSLDFFRL